MGAVPARFITRRNQHEPAIFHELDAAFQNPELRRIHRIVGGIHRDQASLDFRELRLRIVIAGRRELVQHIVRVFFHGAFHQSRETCVGFITRGALLLHL
jgi:hypothetical protein